jgi:hypothetical protein
MSSQSPPGNAVFQANSEANPLPTSLFITRRAGRGLMVTLLDIPSEAPAVELPTRRRSSRSGPPHGVILDDRK